MNCVDVRKFVYLYLDGELAAHDRGEFEGHLAGCLECRETVGFEARFRGSLRQALRATDPKPDSAALRARVEAALVRETVGSIHADRGASSVSSWRWVGLPLAAAASLGLVVASGAYLTSRGSSPADIEIGPSGSARAANPTRSEAIPPVATASRQVEPAFAAPVAASGGVSPAAFTAGGAPAGGPVRASELAVGLVRAHADPLPAEFVGTREEIARYVRAKAPFRSAPPLRESSTIRLLGVRLDHCADEPVVVYYYSVFGKPVTAIQRPNGEGQEYARASRPITSSSTLGGYHLVHIDSGDVTTHLVSDLDQPAVDGLMPVAYVQ